MVTMNYLGSNAYLGNKIERNFPTSPQNSRGRRSLGEIHLKSRPKKPMARNRAARSKITTSFTFLDNVDILRMPSQFEIMSRARRRHFVPETNADVLNSSATRHLGSKLQSACRIEHPLPTASPSVIYHLIPGWEFWMRSQENAWHGNTVWSDSCDATID